MLRSLIAGVRTLIRRQTVNEELDDEVRHYIELAAAEKMRAGVSREDAERAARIEFGGVEATKTRVRAGGWESTVDSFWQDLRYAVRGLNRSRAFTATAVMTLALGIGANAAVFSVVDRLLLRLPPMLRDPARTQRVYFAHPTPQLDGEFFVDGFSYRRYLDLTVGARSFAHTAGYADQTLPIGAEQDAPDARLSAVSASYFDFFNAPPVLGRYFAAEEDAPPKGAAVVVLSYATWQARYAGRANALGATLQIGSTPYTVIGVAPRGFVGLSPDQPPVVFIPISMVANGGRDPRAGPWWSSYSGAWGSILVERNANVSVEMANKELTELARRSWDADGGPSALRPRSMVASLLEERGPNGSSVGKVAALVGGMALIVLLIACANVANLLLARALRRRREIAVRLALGVSRWRLLSQLLTESVLLAVLGGIASLAVARWGGSVLRAQLLPSAAGSTLIIDTRTLMFVAIAVAVAGVVTVLAPAWQAGRIELGRDLKSGNHEGAMHRAGARVALLIVQASLSVVLLVGAGLFVRSLDHVKRLPLGYDVAPILTVNLNMRGVHLDSAAATGLRVQLLATARHLPNVERAALNIALPFGHSPYGGFSVPGIPIAARAQLPNFYSNAVTPDYFATMGTGIVRGRGIVDADAAGAPGAIVISRTMAKLLWPGRDPLGQCAKIGNESTCRYIVGIAEDIKNRFGEEPEGSYYLSAAQDHPQRTSMVIRVRGDASEQVDVVRQALQKQMPGTAYVTVRPYASVVGAQMQSWQLGATMFVVFGVLALVLAAVGLYGVIAYNVTQRSHEIGVRIALGARMRDVILLVGRQSAVVGGAGIAIGGIVALVFAGRLAPLLFNESPHDPVVYTIVGAAMLVTVAAASVVPARRAACVDPNVALRSE